MKQWYGIRVVVCGAFLLAGMVAACPAISAESFEIGVYGAGMQPQGDFSDQTDDASPGFDVQGFYRLPMAPLSIGLELGYVRYGSEQRTEPFSDTIPDVRVRVNRHNHIVRGGLVMKLQQTWGRVTPHLDGALGLHHLWTSTSVESRDTHMGIVHSTILGDTSPALGIGGGVDIEVFHDEEKNVSVSLATAIRYTRGGKASYLTEGDISITDAGEVVTDEHRSRTDMMDIRAGIAVLF